jgi:phospholipid/cholesterol/gamma-HCH transport system substrate-binding protein
MMLLTRLVRTQLIIFTTASVIGLAVMMVVYLQVPTFLGVGQITVTLELPASGGLYRFSNVTYRGVQVGKVTAVQVVAGKQVEATLKLYSSPRIPADLVAQVRSISAVGEQYVDLQPRNESPPFLEDGSVIAMPDTTVPQQVGPMLDQLSALVGSIPQDKLSSLLDESFKGLNGAGDDFGSLLDSSAKLTGDLNGVADRARTLVDDSGPLLDSQVRSTDALREWARSLAVVTDHVTKDDPQVRTLLQTGPGAAQEVSHLLQQVKPTLPILLANLSTVGQIGVTYHASIEQLLVLLPPNLAADQSVAPRNNPTGYALGDFAITIGDPTPCTVGFLPPSQWRSPADTSDIDTPDGLYCKLPQDSPISVRGARNYPCMGHPGKRAPTVEICDSDKPFEPLAMHEHVLGPYPIDPNLISQGIPTDDRVDPGANIYGPIQGTPPPPGMPTPQAGPPAQPAQPEGTPPPPEVPPVGPAPVESTPTDAAPPPASAAGAPSVAPGSYRGNGSQAGPSVAVVHYNSQTGAYMGPDGHMYRQTDLVTSSAPKSWTDLVLSK